MHDSYVQYMCAHTCIDTCTCTTLSEHDEIHLILSNARKITHVQQYLTHAHTRTCTRAQKSLCVITYQHQVTISGENTSEANYRKGIRLLSPESWCDHCPAPCERTTLLGQVAADGMSGKPILAQLEPCLPISSCKWQYIVMLQCWQYTVFTHFTQVSNTWELVQPCSCDRVTLLVSGNSRWNVCNPIPNHLEALCKPQYLCKRQPTTTNLTCHTVNATAASETVTVFTMCSFRTYENTASFLYLFTIKNSIVTYWKLQCKS